MAQALAQAAVHDDQIIRAFLLPAEMMACKIGKPGDKSLLQILNDVRTDKTLTASLEWTYENKIQDGILARASEQMIKHAAEFTVSEDQMEVRLADMINTVGQCGISNSNNRKAVILTPLIQSTIPVQRSDHQRRSRSISSSFTASTRLSSSPRS